MDALQLRRVQEPRRVADEDEAVAVELGLRVVAAFRNGLRAVTQHLAAVEQALDARVLLPLDEQRVRIELRVALVEAHDEAK